MDKKNKYKLLYDISLQLACVHILFLILFIEARFSNNYDATWTEYVKSFVARANAINVIVMLALIAITVFFKIRSGTRIRKNITKDQIEAAGYIAALFVFHIFVRVPMLGTYQLSDAWTYLYFINNNMAFPDALLTDFVHNGFLAGGHLSHGFIFTTALGQLLNSATGMGFQHSQMVFGAFSAVFLFGIAKKILPKEKNIRIFMIALITSIQPMFLGLSTTLQMEYMLTVLFIFSLFFILYEKYVLAFFWLLCLATCKETGLMMALSIVFFGVMFNVIGRVKKKGSFIVWLKNMKKIYYVVFLAVFTLVVFVAIKVANYPFWGGYRIIDVLKVGGAGNMTFKFDKGHFFIKLGQLFVLNFSWIWSGIILVYILLLIFFKRFRKNNSIDGRIFAQVIIQYVIHTVFLLFFPEAKLPRYNMLSDMLFLLLAMVCLSEMIDSLKVYMPASVVVALITFTEVFLTVDPATRALFTAADTGNGVPMVWAAKTKSEFPKMQMNIGEFGFYNYQYTFVDRGFDRMLDEVDYQSWYRVLSAANNAIEDQISCGMLRWDAHLKTRRYYGEGIEHIFPVDYVTLGEVYESESGQPARLILFLSPWCEYDIDDIYRKMSGIYNFSEPHNINVGCAGSFDYYILYIK